MKKAKILVLISVIIIVVIYIDNKITTYHMGYYHGKDGGIFSRIKSICVLSMLFFLLMSKRNRIVQIIIGFFIGLLSVILSYIFWTYLFSDIGLVFHITACVIFIVLFFILEKSIDSWSDNFAEVYKDLKK